MKERRTPWRERERPSLWRSPRWHVSVVILAGMACVTAVQGAIAVVVGGRTPAGDTGVGAVVYYTLVALAVAVPSTWLVWAYVRRPVEGGEHGADPERARADRVRDDAERTAWRSR